MDQEQPSARRPRPSRPRVQSFSHIDGATLLEDVERIAGESVKDVTVLCTEYVIPPPGRSCSKASHGSLSGAWFHGAKLW